MVLLLTMFHYRVSKAQCNLTYYAGIGVPNSGTTFATWSGFGPGQYFAMPVLSGGSYAISTCGAGINTELTGWDPPASSVIFYNDNNGPLCTGNAASVDNYIPSFTNYIYVQVTQAACQAGGSASINLYLRQNDNLVFTLPTTTLCAGQSLSLSATPANVGSTPSGYGSPGLFTGSGVAGNVFTAPSVTGTTTYTLSYTFGYVTKTATISVMPSPTIAVSVSSPSVCFGSTVAITGTGVSSYTLSNGAANGAAFTPSATASYTVRGSNGCGITSSVVTVSVIPLPAIFVTGGSICLGGSFTLVPSGADTYTFSGGNTVITPTATASYSVAGTNTLTGCTNTAITTITVNPLPSIAIMSNDSLICSGESATLTPTGGINYVWNGGANVMQIVITPTANTTYTVTGNDSNGCSNTAMFTETVALCLGIAQPVEAENLVQVYPNPNQGEFVIHVHTAGTRVFIYNETGHLVKDLPPGNTDEAINVAALANGVYFVRAVNGYTVNQQKVIVTH